MPDVRGSAPAGVDAAMDVAAACRAAARALRDSADDRARAVAAVRMAWEGPHRRAFDDALAALERQNAALEDAALAGAAWHADLARQATAAGGGGW